MRIAIVGAGNVGRSIARELLDHGHDVTLLERDPRAMKTETVPGARWVLADACEIGSLEEVELDTFDVSVAATGDDKANLVHTFLAKTEFGVPRTVGRVNHSGNEWMFDEVWGVDLAVSMPRLMTALVEEAVTVGDAVRLFSFRDGDTHLMELTLPASSSIVGTSLGSMDFGPGIILVAIIRGGRPLAPDPAVVFEDGDELLLLAETEQEARLTALIASHSAPTPDPDGADPDRVETDEAGTDSQDSSGSGGQTQASS